MSEFTEAREAVRLFGDLPSRWGVAGGWAIDLFLDRITRNHDDIEIAIFREDQHSLQEYLSLRGWRLEVVRDGRLLTWRAGEMLSLPVHEIWCHNSDAPLKRVEVLLNERNADEFIYRRDLRIRTNIQRSFVRSSSGIPILAPEIVLLYKSKYSSDAMEQLDLSNAWSELDSEQREWLLNSIALTDPEHSWLQQGSARR